MWAEETKGGGDTTFDKFFVHTKNLLHHQFVEENPAYLIRCGEFSISEEGVGLLVGHHCLPLTPHRVLGSQLHNATLGILGRKDSQQTAHILISSEPSYFCLSCTPFQ